MNFASDRTYFSKNKMPLKRLSDSEGEEDEKEEKEEPKKALSKTEEAKPILAKLEEVKDPKYQPKMSQIPEIDEELEQSSIKRVGRTEERQKSRSRSRSSSIKLCSSQILDMQAVANNELSDEEHSDHSGKMGSDIEEDDDVKQVKPIIRASRARAGRGRGARAKYSPKDDDSSGSEEEEKKPKKIKKEKMIKDKGTVSYLFKKKDNVSMKQDEPKSMAPQMASMSVPQPPKDVYQQEIDSNVVAIELGVLNKKTAIATGDPIFCGICKASFNSFSKFDKQEDKSLKWVCEFCNHTQVLKVEDEEIPKVGELTYILQSAKQSQSLDNTNKTSIIFCMDISGSMCVSMPVEGKHKFKFAHKTNEDEFMKWSDGSLQFLDKESRNVTYITRMQCVQAAIEKQIQTFSSIYPNMTVGIVLFNNEVTLIGDGSKEPLIITGDKLNDYNTITDIAKESHEAYFTTPIIKSKELLLKKLNSIEENGGTALGPALLLSVYLASKGSKGSKVIISTDGIANQGLGSIEGKTEEELVGVKEFYSKIGSYAKEFGIMVSAISITGEECKLAMLSSLTELSGGEIMRVDPLKLDKDFSNLLSEDIIATNVNIKVKLHKALEFRNENPINLIKDENTMQRDIGNVLESSEITFEYTLKSKEELQKLTDIKIEAIKIVPFQTQITYMSLEGAKCMRIITQVQEVTSQRKKAKKNIKPEVISKNAVQHSVALAKEGKYREAQTSLFTWGTQFKNDRTDYETYWKNSKPIYNNVQEELATETMSKKAVASSRPISMTDKLTTNLSHKSKESTEQNRKKFSKK